MSDAKTITVEIAPAKGSGGAIFMGQDGFCILKTIIRENPDKPASVGSVLTCVGTLHNPIIGGCYKLTGHAKWSERHNAYQLHFNSYELTQTATATGLQNYLAKECQFIGEGRADQIVKLYGDKSWDVLLNHPEKLAEDITGVNLIQAQSIQAWAKAEQEVSTVKKKFYEAGLTEGLIKRLLNAYGANVEDKLKENTFGVTEVKGIGFLTADRIAKKFGMPPTHPQRLKEGILYALQEVMDDKGHTCVEHHTLVNAAVKLLEVHKNHIIDVIKSMLTERTLVTQRDNPAEFSLYPELFAKADAPLELKEMP